MQIAALATSFSSLESLGFHRGSARGSPFSTQFAWIFLIPALVWPPWRLWVVAHMVHSIMDESFFLWCLPPPPFLRPLSPRLFLLGVITPADSSADGVSALLGTVESKTEAEVSAELGTNATVSVVQDVETVEEVPFECPAGFWCSAGNDIPCGFSTYNNRSGAYDQSACTYCPASSFTLMEGSTSETDCICEAGFYALWKSAGLECKDCPVGANCTVPGLTFEFLPLDEGYWRTSNATDDVRRCPGSLGGSACVGCGGAGCEVANFSGCKPGITGPYCSRCETRSDDEDSVYFDVEEQDCLPCRESGSNVAAIVMAAVLLFCLLGCAALAIKRHVSQQAKQGEEEDALSHLVHAEEKWWKRHAKSIKRRLKIKVKVLFTFYQIATKVPSTYKVIYPPSVETQLAIFSFVNLELDGFGLPLACAGLGGFESKLLFMMLAPVAVLLVTKCVGFVSRDRSHEKDTRASLAERRQSATVPARRMSATRDSAVVLGTAYKQAVYKALPIMLRVTFLAFPTVSSLAFKALPTNCDHLDGALPRHEQRAVMSADYAVVCWEADGEFTDEYWRILLITFAALVAYPVLIPLSYAVLLYKVRHDVWSGTPTKLSEAVTFLTEEYDAAFFFWELVEVMKKLVLVGVMSIVMPGEIYQLVIGFIVVLCFLVTLMIAKPYKRAEDDVIALAAGFGLVLFFFFSLILKFQVLIEAVDDSLTGQLKKTFAIDSETNTVLLVCSTLGALVLGSAMIVIELSAAAVVQKAEQRKQVEMKLELARLRLKEQCSAAELDALKAVLSEEQMPDIMRRCHINANDLEVSRTKKLGTGRTGDTWQATLNGTPVAVKKMHRNLLDADHLKTFREECELQLALRHPNLVQLIGGSWTLEDVNVYSVLELCERGTLWSLLSKQGAMLSWAKHKLPIATAIARGMAFLHHHDPPVVHRDLHPGNVLISHGFDAKICDFGSSKSYAGGAAGAAGKGTGSTGSDQFEPHQHIESLAEWVATMEDAGASPLYVAPELLKREAFDEGVDVWAFACILEVLWSHKEPYEGRDELRELRRPGVDAAEYGHAVVRLVADGQLRPQAEQLIDGLVERCGAVDPAERPSFAQVVEQLCDPQLSTEAFQLRPGPPGGGGAPMPGVMAMPAPAAAVNRHAPPPPQPTMPMPKKKTLPAPKIAAAARIARQLSKADGPPRGRQGRGKAGDSGDPLDGWDEDGASAPVTEPPGRHFERRDSQEKFDALQKGEKSRGVAERHTVRVADGIDVYEHGDDTDLSA